VAVDDIGQENTLFLPSIEVTFYASSAVTTNSEDFNSDLSSSSTLTSGIGEDNTSIGELVLAGTIFVGSILTGNFVNRKRRG
ncbi:MAG: hypothetical protein ACW991_02655, partial [Candidatus Hodarchaeales archaeon]